jgi:hypothetical protein
MRRLTGTHVYSYVKCPRLAALDLHLSRAERREPTEWEEFAAKRGRDFEDAYVKDLGVVQPAYPERDFEAGFAATQALLRDGTPLIHQAVLFVEDRLGLPDLLRKLPGASELGDHHYEVIDVKTSGRSRGDQILQVVFYSQLLALVQGRLPEHGALVLKDGREERFLIADYAAAGTEVLAALRRLRDDPSAARPFLQMGCSGCYHDQRCLPELAKAQDLSLVQGMSHGAQAILEGLGCRTIADLAVFHPDHARQRGNLDATLLRRLRRAAQAHLLGKPILEVRPRGERLDAARDRAPADGSVRGPRARDWHALPGDRSGAVHVGTAAHGRRRMARAAPPRRRPAAARAAAALRRGAAALARRARVRTRSRSRARSALRRSQQAPARCGGLSAAVFGLADLVREGLGRDPFRAGHPGAAAMWTTMPDGDDGLRAKLHADLLDLAALKAQVLDAVPTVVGAVEAAPGAAIEAAAE